MVVVVVKYFLTLHLFVTQELFDNNAIKYNRHLYERNINSFKFFMTKDKTANDTATKPATERMTKTFAIQYLIKRHYISRAQIVANF